ncbi:MAG: methyltransferase domain-containing protein [Bacteriovoracaceae bacterium]|jgi:SAM-dependent methyltransferase|nr:methyltransferase domain-containing protein [Bacteriovoracaceae bacterium]
MGYILSGKNEPKRLDDQSSTEEFSLKGELSQIMPKDGSKVLDAGCGSGVLCRYLNQQKLNLQLHGCDISKESLSYAKNNSSKNINFFTHNFVDSAPPNQYDVIYNRLVAHHLGEELTYKGYCNLYKSLNNGGKLHVIDVDGIMINIGSSNKQLTQKVYEISQGFQGSFNTARHIPHLLAKIGFKNIKWQIQIMDFQNKDRVLEAIQWKERLTSAKDFLLNFFDSEFEVHKFIKNYTEEISKETTVLFYNKFIISAQKETPNIS